MDPGSAGYLFRPTIHADAFDADKPVSTHARVLCPALRLPIRRTFECPDEDLVALELTSDSATKFGFRPFDLTDSLRDPADGYLANFTGYPYDLTEALDRDYGKIVMNSEWANVDYGRSDERFLKGFSADRHLLLPYLSGGEGRQPYGFSGSGVWWHERPPSVWYPNLRLGGIVVGAYRRPHRLVALRASRIQGFLETL
jgi:hypothetical protein